MLISQMLAFRLKNVTNFLAGHAAAMGVAGIITFPGLDSSLLCKLTRNIKWLSIFDSKTIQEQAGTSKNLVDNLTLF